LDGITTEIGVSIASGQAQAAVVYIPLLQHLANPDGMLLNRHFVF
jgi:hypothetical protein